MNRVEQKLSREANKPEQTYALNPVDEIFMGEPLQTAEKLDKLEAEETSTDAKPQKKVSNKKRLVKTAKKKKTTVVAKKVRT